jgi:hypothetical protein
VSDPCVTSGEPPRRDGRDRRRGTARVAPHAVAGDRVAHVPGAVREAGHTRLRRRPDRHRGRMHTDARRRARRRRARVRQARHNIPRDGRGAQVGRRSKTHVDATARWRRRVDDGRRGRRAMRLHDVGRSAALLAGDAVVGDRVAHVRDAGRHVGQVALQRQRRRGHGCRDDGTAGGSARVVGQRAVHALDDVVGDLRKTQPVKGMRVYVMRWAKAFLLEAAWVGNPGCTAQNRAEPASPPSQNQSNLTSTTPETSPLTPYSTTMPPRRSRAQSAGPSPRSEETPTST